MIYTYACDTHGKVDIVKSMDEYLRQEKCPVCGAVMGKIYGVRVTGTRDNFGVGKAFRDEKTGKEIDNWRSWERAGYREPDRSKLPHETQERMKEKIQTYSGRYINEPIKI